MHINRPLFAALLALSTAPVARAQLQVEIVDPQANYLLYEPILLKIKISNGSGRTMELKDSGDKTWLRFLVTHGGAMMVKQEKSYSQPGMVLDPGDVARFTFNLTPYYGLRESGAYAVQAVIRVPGFSGDVISRPRQFNILRGREVWSKIVTPLGASQPRKYSLLTHMVRDEQQGIDRNYLYAQVESETENLVFTCRQLGPVVQGDRIESLFDASYGWHVLFRSGANTFGYFEFDVDGRVTEKKEMAKTKVRPRLVTKGGMVELVGGMSREEFGAGDTLTGSQPPAVLTPGAGLPPSEDKPSRKKNAEDPPQ